MALVDKLGQFAGKVGDVAGDTLDLGKAKGKIVLEKGKIKDVKEAIGEYVYTVVKEGGIDALDIDKIMEFCAEIDEHKKAIEGLEEDASKSSAELSGRFKGSNRSEDE